MSRKISSLGEFGLIEWIPKTVPFDGSVKRAIGDDAAVLPLTKEEDLLFTTDMIVEDVHFTCQMSPQDIGHKALACNLSDIAAMGGTPTYAVVSLGVPPETDTAFARGIYQGMISLGKKFKVSIVGGDTVKSDKIVINVALLGKVRKGKAVLRGGAKPGDRIFVTGPLGGSFESGRHLKFIPRLKEAQFLADNFHPSSMIDISDGLAADLGHILEESGVGAVIQEQMIPRNPGVDLENVLGGGEDFELLFTLSPGKTRALFKSAHPFLFYPIGEITAGKWKLFLADQAGGKTRIAPQGFKHF